jgi:hypothetical protein
MVIDVIETALDIAFYDQWAREGMPLAIICRLP